jgi:hypothetical protein
MASPQVDDPAPSMALDATIILPMQRARLREDPPNNLQPDDLEQARTFATDSQTDSRSGKPPDPCDNVATGGAARARATHPSDPDVPAALAQSFCRSRRGLPANHHGGDQPQPPRLSRPTATWRLSRGVIDMRAFAEAAAAAGKAPQTANGTGDGRPVAAAEP